jgi:hypothetical protein
VTRFLLLSSLSLVAAIGCGGSVQNGASTDGAPQTDSGAGGDGYVPPDAPPDASVDVVTSCDAPTPLSSLFVGSSCTAIVRVSPASTIVGWSVACGAPKIATEPDARAAFAPYIGPYTTLDGYRTIGDTTTNDEFIFYESPGDFGGMGVVSWARTDVLFAANLAWMGPTKITYPTGWRPADEIVARCAPATLGRVRIVSADGAPMDDASIAPARAAVETSLLPIAIGHAGHAIANTVVTDLPASDASGALTRETLFFLNSGLLE